MKTLYRCKRCGRKQLDRGSPWASFMGCRSTEGCNGSVECLTEWRIYALTCPISGYVKYIGCTSLDLDQRLKAHLSIVKNSRLNTSARCRWIKWIKRSGKIPAIHLLGKFWCSKRTALQYERGTIYGLKKIGVRLMNDRATSR
jgi:hypothetical protein